MPEYIERKAAEKVASRYGIAYKIAEIPEADVSRVVHGRWEVDEFGHFCTVCREYTEEVENGEGQLDPLITPYCPNCGARMDGDKNA